MAVAEKQAPAKGKITPVSRKPSKPAWYKNTYFWIAGILFIIAIIGLPFIGGDKAIRDPGQKTETIPLFLIYVAASIIMLVNGWLSHKQTVQHYLEEVQGAEK